MLVRDLLRRQLISAFKTSKRGVRSASKLKPEINRKSETSQQQQPQQQQEQEQHQQHHLRRKQQTITNDVYDDRTDSSSSLKRLLRLKSRSCVDGGGGGGNAVGVIDFAPLNQRKHALDRPLRDDLATLGDSGAEMYGRLAAESSSMLDELHGETGRQKLASIQQRLIFEEREKLGMKDHKEDELRSQVPCAGCGAPLHSVEVTLPGFVPIEVFVEVKRQNPDDPPTESCLRCYTLVMHQKALKVVVPDSEFPLILHNHVTSGLRERVQGTNPLSKELEKRGVLFMMLIDALDPEGSCFNGIKNVLQAAEGEIPSEFLHHRRRHLRGGVKVVLVVNKIDLLPKDAPNALEHWKKVFGRIFRDLTGLDESSHVATHLISARTGYGVEDLISDVWLKWKLKGDVYLCGSTNAGKSTLFNILLQSDFCLPTAMDQISPATISPWPGTTLRMLSFPLNRTDDFKIKLRMKRLYAYRKWMWNESQEIGKEELDWDNVELKGQVGRSFEEFRRGAKQRYWERKQMKDGVDLRAIVAFEGDGHGNIEEPDRDWDRMFQKRFPLQKSSSFVMKYHKESVQARWVYDTPGIVNSHQLINYLVEEEIEEVIPKGVIPPRFCMLRIGRSLLLSGIAQIDLLEHYGPQPKHQLIHIAVIASHSLPLRITWNYGDAERLRREEEMICEQKKEKKRILPFILPGDDPWREGRGAERGLEELEIMDGQWRSGGAEGDDVEIERGRIHGRNDSSSYRRSRLDKSRHEDEDEEASFVQEDGSIFNASFSSSSSSLRSRPRPLPPWTSQTFRVSGLFPKHSRWWEASAAEILLSSLGFVCVTTGDDCLIRVRTFGGTGDSGTGIRTGDSILLPDIFQLQGVRGGRTAAPEDGKGRHLDPFYETKKPFF